MYSEKVSSSYFITECYRLPLILEKCTFPKKDHERGDPSA